ncbi:MAG: endonuclease domain-containing protein [Burkholderiales bacterium]|jgi:very-short-patch-repair endonuclease|nr:endonuclease domain-containing protein [Burkholderiales bacterium]
MNMQQPFKNGAHAEDDKKPPFKRGQQTPVGFADFQAHKRVEAPFPKEVGAEDDKKPPFQRGWTPKADGGLLPREKALKPLSRTLRKNATKQENHLWHDFLRHCKPRFTRQRIIGKYVVDFYCHHALLVVELDGSQHYEPGAMVRDETRTTCLNALGLQVLRFANNEVDRDFEGVCMMIKEKMNASSKCR